MADFRRGIKAGVVTGFIYLAIAGILGSVVIHYRLFSVARFLYGTGLTLYPWSSLTDPSSMISLMVQHLISGVTFGAVFAALYSSLPGTASIKKGAVLAAFVWIVAALGSIYMTPGWPTEGSMSWSYCGGGAVVLSSIGPALAGITSALIFGALTGFLWDRFRPKRLVEASRGNPVLLVSFILAGVIWTALAVAFVVGVVISGEVPAIGPHFWWMDLLLTSAVFLGLPGWILVLIAWRGTRRGKSGFGWGMAGGVLMVLTGVMLLPGTLSIIGGVLSRREPPDQIVTAEGG